MDYPNTKVYFDGSHYIAIPYIPNLKKKRKPKQEELISVCEEPEKITSNEIIDEPLLESEKPCKNVIETTPTENKEPTIRIISKKDLFEELYEATRQEKKTARREIIFNKMRPYFKNDLQASNYISEQFERKERNAISKRIRLCRKVYMQEFNYFCTFTYDGNKHDEETFKKKLRTCFKMLCHRKKWKYVGVWERSPKKQRLHFHGLFYVPAGSMPGELIQVEDYNTTKHKRQITTQNTYFNERFGRSDFETVNSRSRLGEAIAYIIKYIEKTGEKIVYSKGLPQYFYSDIMEEDIVCNTGIDDRKLLLFDDFGCWDEGCYMGQVNKETIEQMRKCN